jgi:hypothetical protein
MLLSFFMTIPLHTATEDILQHHALMLAIKSWPQHPHTFTSWSASSRTLLYDHGQPLTGCMRRLNIWPCLIRFNRLPLFTYADGMFLYLPTYLFPRRTILRKTFSETSINRWDERRRILSRKANRWRI